MKAVGTWQGGYRTLLDDGTGHTITVDLPSDEGGGDVGPYALELSVLSLAGCMTTIFALVAKRRKMELERMNIELEAERPRGSPTITSIHGVLRVATSASRGEAETVLEITQRTCPVGLLFEKAHIPVRVRLDVRETLPSKPAPAPS